MGESPAIPVPLLREALARHGSVRVCARGGSMGSAVPDGSVCTVVAGRPRRGDLVALTYGETLVLHRVWSCSPLRTRGDRAHRWDPPGSLLGVVSLVAPPQGPKRVPGGAVTRLGGLAGAMIWALVARFRRGGRTWVS